MILLLILDEESLGTNIPMDKFVRSNMSESLEEATVRLMEDSLAEDLVNMVDVNPLIVASFELMVGTTRNRILPMDNKGTKPSYKLPMLSTK